MKTKGKEFMSEVLAEVLPKMEERSELLDWFVDRVRKCEKYERLLGKIAYARPSLKNDNSSDVLKKLQKKAKEVLKP